MAKERKDNIPKYLASDKTGAKFIDVSKLPKEEFEEIWRKLVENKKIKEEIMKNEKKLYVKDFLNYNLI